jgi:hypothetical protein
MLMISARNAGASSGLYRAESTTRAAAFTTAVLVGLIVLAVVPGRAEIAGYIFAPLWLVATWRAWRLGVHVEADGVRVVGFLGSKRVAWEDVDHFEVRPWGKYPYVGYIVLTGARMPVTIVGITTAGGKTDRHRLQAQVPIDRLNGALAEWREANIVKQAHL